MIAIAVDVPRARALTPRAIRFNNADARPLGRTVPHMGPRGIKEMARASMHHCNTEDRVGRFVEPTARA